MTDSKASDNDILIELAKTLQTDSSYKFPDVSNGTLTTTTDAITLGGTGHYTYPSNNILGAPVGGTWPNNITTTVGRSEAEVIDETLSKVKLINLLSEDAQIKLIVDGMDIFKYIVDPSDAVIAVHDGLNNL